MSFVVIFDLDGTLVDTPAAIVENFAAAFDVLGTTQPSAADIRATIGLPLEQSFAKLLGVPMDDALVASGVEQYRQLYPKIVLPQAHRLVYPGVTTGVRRLRERGFTLAIATSKRYASAHALLKAAGLRECFDIVVGADQVRRPKPDPESALQIAHQLCISPRRTVVVGDTSYDLLMAKAAGMRSIAVTYGVHSRRELDEASPSWTADTFHDVMRAIQTAYRTVTFDPWEIWRYVNYDGIFY
ncbi:hydrolase [Rhizocola hellebori]|uniref:Tyrosine-protein kinase PtkA n=1 Tax=Rhizocola hellebori TaxID=1392758 RepID=A0A8J3Q7C6_9ACTN|nr:HAD family hydrolase [Rhizocola hellebori]GIH05175.1 hydrolase [Rhizocola hellebori]